MIDSLKEKMPHLAARMAEYARLYERIVIPAKTILLREGERSRKYFFIEKGCLRVSFNHGGKDVTFQFFFEGQGVSSAESFKKNTPSHFSIESIEPSIIQVLKKKDFENMMRDLGNDPEFLSQMVDILFERQLYYMNEFMSFIRDTPQQRYERLVKEKAHIIQRIPQHYIASYLGITPVSLSRIRNKLNRKIV
jgi:CRP-like cAMP-binding protein